MNQPGQPLQACQRCGAGLSLDDLRLPNCRYCGTVLAHHAQAAEHAALVNRILQQQGVHHVQVPYQHGAPLPPVGMPAPYAQHVEQHLDQARRTMTVVIVASAIGALLVMGVAGAVIFLVL